MGKVKTPFNYNVLIITELKSILYYLCAKLTTTRPITDTAQHNNNDYDNDNNNNNNNPIHTDRIRK
jgi:hypothetical protein